MLSNLKSSKSDQFPLVKLFVRAEDLSINELRLLLPVHIGIEVVVPSFSALLASTEDLCLAL